MKEDLEHYQHDSLPQILHKKSSSLNETDKLQPRKIMDKENLVVE
jgi:hypothetical protein